MNDQNSMQARPLTIASTDGFLLAATLYTPLSPTSQGVVVINSGLSTKRTFYHRFACYLAEKGFVVITYDYRGIAESRPEQLKGFFASMHEWGQKDIAGVINWVNTHYPQSPLLVVGHSVGSILLGLAPNCTRVDALLAIAASGLSWKLLKAPGKYRLLCALFLSRVIARLCGYLPTHRSGMLRGAEDLPRGVLLDFACWCLHADISVNHQGNRIHTHHQEFTVPLLTYSFEKDKFCPVKSVESFLSMYPNAKKRHQRWSYKECPVGHFNFFKKPDAMLLWQKASEWLLEQSRSKQHLYEPEEV
jgi:predicted alpha/beta hydrolase